MNKTPAGVRIEHLAVLPAPRLERHKRHKLSAMLVIAVCAVLCGAERFPAMEGLWAGTGRVAQPVSGTPWRHSLARHLHPRLSLTGSAGVSGVFSELEAGGGRRDPGPGESE